MLSRTADHLYWMSRCTERAEKKAASIFSTEYAARVQRVRGSLPKEGLC
ncbi:MAG: alpha-E domain-containing protein [Comamonas sp.]|nr:alpha-E domain-containing protein [Comamonas sp.]MDN5538089.1 alpha-E domain-containing protein [Comamonas sp.]